MEILKIFTAIIFLLIPSIVFPFNYIIQKNDTLSSIAQKELGDQNKWRDLANWNRLDIEWRDNAVYIHLVPGQKISLQKKIFWTTEKVQQYRLNTKYGLEREIFRMIGVNKIPEFKVEYEIRYDAKYEAKYQVEFAVNFSFDPDCQHGLRLTQIQLKKILSDLAIHERFSIANEIFSYSRKHPLNFLKAEEWIVHRKTSLILMALIETESDGYFVKGKHGEFGIYQIKLSTFKLIMKRITNIDSDVELELMTSYVNNEEGVDSKIEVALMTSHLIGMKYALEILQKGKDIFGAFQKYNSHSELKERREYARRVLKSYKGMMRRMRKLDRGLFE